MFSYSLLMTKLPVCQSVAASLLHSNQFSWKPSCCQKWGHFSRGELPIVSECSTDCLFLQRLQRTAGCNVWLIRCRERAWCSSDYDWHRKNRTERDMTTWGTELQLMFSASCSTRHECWDAIRRDGWMNEPIQPVGQRDADESITLYERVTAFEGKEWDSCVIEMLHQEFACPMTCSLLHPKSHIDRLISVGCGIRHKRDEWVRIPEMIA